MPASTLNNDGSKIILGPGQLWADVAVPAAGARMTLFTDGTPDSTANPNAKHLGLTKSGASITFGLETQDFESDELTSPHLSRIIKQPMMIEAELLQLTDVANVMKYVMPGSTYATGAGYKELAFGGLNAITYYSFALICADVADATKFICIQLYKAYNKSGVNFTITRKDQGAGKVQLQGLSIATRAVGDQTGKWFIQI